MATPILASRPEPRYNTMAPSYERGLPLLLFILVSVSAVASLPQVESAWNGIKEVAGEQDMGLRILREVVLLLILPYAFLQRRLRQAILSPEVLAFSAVIATYALAETLYALYRDLPIVVPLSGLRVFEYLPLAFIGLGVARLGAGERVMTRFVGYLRWYLGFQALLAIVQAIWAPPILGYSLLGGGRPFGTFVSPNLFGAAMATCTLVFALMQNPKLSRWAWLAGFLALLSGSRTAFLSSLLVLFFRFLKLIRARDRWLLWLPAPILGVGALVLASSSAVSGRDDADPTEDGRIALWTQVLGDNIHEPWDLLFGWGLGLSSNTINVLFGEDYFPGQFNSDSLYLFLLNGYGLLGLLGYLGVLWLSVRVSGHRDRGLIMFFIFLAGLPFNLWEYFPQNAMLMFVWGLVLGTPELQRLPANFVGSPFADWRR